MTPIPAGASVPVFESNFFSGSRAVAHVFLTFATSSIPWFKVNTPSPLPKVVSIEVTGTNAPRVTATVMNPTASAMTNVPFIVTIFGEDGNAIGASRTVALSIPPQGQADLVFTWPTPFVGTVSKIEIVPIILPTP